MEKIQEIKSLIDKAVWQASLYYVGIFYRDTELISMTSSRSKKLSSSFGRLIERSLELSRILPNFKEEFLFSEGKDYSLFVYYINQDISIGMIHIGKPNFSLLKVTSSDLAKSLQPYLSFLSDMYNQKVKHQADADLVEAEKPTEPPKNTGLKSADNQGPNLKTEISTPTEKSSEDRKATEKFPEVQKIEDVSKEAFEKLEEFEFNAPSLEEIFQQDLVEDLSQVQDESEGALENFEDIIDKISIEFIKEIGPFGKFLFKKKKEEFFKGKAITKLDLLKFVNLLSEEISIPHRKEEFLEKAKSHLINL